MTWLWVLRAAWVALPMTAGAAVAGGLDELARPAAVLGAVLLWAAWGGGLVAMLVPSTVSLTTIRVVVPAAVVVGAVALGAGHGGWLGEIGLGLAALALVATLAPATVDAFVDGSSYGRERRFALRIPVTVLVGPLPLAWLGVVAGTVTGPLLLADQRWPVGILAIAFGGPAAVVGVRALHGLSRRWIVFVPNGLVDHDHMALADPLLVPRTLVAGLALAPPETAAVDLTLGAVGTPVEIALREPLDVPLGRATGRAGETVEATALLVSPVRPGVLLAEAAGRRLV